MKKEQEHEIALSYAHKDEKIAEMIKEELENIFAGSFFMDSVKPEELSNASIFKEKLKDIFQRSNYAIILYSEGYKEGTFTGVEKESILKKEEEETESHFFIINVDDCKIPEGEILHNRTYMALKVQGSEENNIREQIYDIVHNKIKKFIVKQSINEKKKQGEYSLNVQTLFENSNLAQWRMDYDWNLLGHAFIGEDGRKVKEGIGEENTWEVFWDYIKKEFNWIKAGLSQEKDTVRRIHLNCHLSIAYKLGQIYGDLRQASGNRNLVLLSSNRVGDNIFTLNKKIPEKEPEEFCQQYEGNNSESTDIVCIIAITPQERKNILETVKNFLKQQGQEYSKICFFQKNMEIEDADTLEILAEYLRKKMENCIGGSAGKIHLFPNTAAPLMFVLGARTIFPGEVQLYEYQPKKNSYEKSLKN